MTAPYSRWSFQNVSEFVPSATVRGNRLAEDTPADLGSLSTLSVVGVEGAEMPLSDFLVASDTDALVVMRKGRLAAEWCAEHCDRDKPHLIFSVTKSLTGLLAGILCDQGFLLPSDQIVRYVPEAAGSAYGDATVQQLLDMEISLKFDENYLDKTGLFNRYRRSTCWAPDTADDPAPDLKSLLCAIPKGAGDHGQLHAYRSPDADMAGIVLERAVGRRFPSLLRDLLWLPLGARSDGMITVDRLGTVRAAGGFSVTARDLARVGELVRTGGGGVVPQGLIDDLRTGGNREAWANGDQAHLFPGGSYRNYWYETGKGELAAIGIHGQWIWISPETETVIVKQSCQPLPADPVLDQALIAMFRRIAVA
jgi:CubicO group peptidase (beta-lactamase class C family)